MEINLTSLCVRHNYKFAFTNFIVMKVLIIEDEAGLQQSIKKYLEHQGFVCEVVGDFVTGMEKVYNFNYDCVVVDIGLPQGSGLDIVKQLKRLESKAGIIIISAKN